MSIKRVFVLLRCVDFLSSLIVVFRGLESVFDDEVCVGVFIGFVGIDLRI